MRTAKLSAVLISTPDWVKFEAKSQSKYSSESVTGTGNLTQTNAKCSAAKAIFCGDKQEALRLLPSFYKLVLLLHCPSGSGENSFCCFFFLPLHKYATNQVDDAFSSACNQWQLWFSVQYSITVLCTLLDFKLQISNVVGFEIRGATVSRRTASGYHEGSGNFSPKTFPYL